MVKLMAGAEETMVAATWLGLSFWAGGVILTADACGHGVGVCGHGGGGW
jgi:hypothetical protein